MKKSFSLLAFLYFSAFFSEKVLTQTNPAIIGVPGKNDRVNRLLRTTDGGFVMAGQVDNDAALYKFDCSGKVINSLHWDLPDPLSYEQFFDVAELPNGELLAIGSINILFKYIGSVAMRLSADLKPIQFDTSRAGNPMGKWLRNIIQAKNGDWVVSGARAGYVYDYEDAFCATFDPVTLRLQDSITTFSYGIDQPMSLIQTADGNFVISGVSILGNIWDIENVWENRAFVRKFKPNGIKTWEHTRSASFKGKFGYASYSSIVENSANGHLLAVGNIFTGDTTTDDILDAHYALLSSSGLLLDTYTLSRPGSQNLWHTIPSRIVPGSQNTFGPDTLLYFAVGDSLPDVRNHTASAFFCTVRETGNQLHFWASATNQAAPVSLRCALEVPTGRFAFAGILYDPTEVPANNEDILFGFPGVEVKTTASGLTASVTEPLGTAFTYQWKDVTGSIAGATNVKFIAPKSGTYTVVVTDHQGCTGSATVSLIVSAVVEPGANWGLSASPNPGTGIFQLAAQNAPEGSLRANVYDASGRLLQNFMWATPGGQLSEGLDLSTLPPGFYLLRLSSSKETGTVRLSVVH